MSLLNLGVLISGRGSNLKAVAAAIDEGRLEAKIRLVSGDNPLAPGLSWAEERGLPVLPLHPAGFHSLAAYESALRKGLQDAGVEWLVLAGYLRIVGPELLRAFPGKTLNIHPSLLPAFPGLNAQAQAVAYGVKYSGCTVHLVDEELDHGPIIAQAVVPVLDDDTAESLAERILEQEHLLYPRVLQWIAEDRLVVKGRKVSCLARKKAMIVPHPNADS